VTITHNTLLVFSLELGSTIRNTFSRPHLYCHFLNAIMQNSINAVTTKVSLRKTVLEVTKTVLSLMLIVVITILTTLTTTIAAAYAGGDDDLTEFI
jgi:hypothetical protein